MLIAIVVLMIFRISDFCMGDEDNFKWTPELDARILDIFYATRPNEVNHQNRMKEMWDKIYPQFKGVQPGALRLHAVNLIFKGGEHGKGNVIWTPELKSDLLEIYRRLASSDAKGISFKLHSEFYKKHSDISRLAPGTLMSRAKDLLIRTGGGHKTDPRPTLGRRIQWRNLYRDEIVQIYRKHPSNNKDQALRLHKEWTRLHPEHKNIDPHFLQIRMRNITREQAKNRESFTTRYKWTRQNNADLLHIYNRIKPEKFGYTLRVHEYWGKMNTDLRFMKKDHLRRRIFDLKEQNYRSTETEEESARIKFDNLSAPEDEGHHKRTPQRVDKGKRRMSPSDEDLASKNTPELTTPSHKFYDFMSVNESHRGSFHCSDKNVQGLCITSSSQAPYNTSVVPNTGNYHHGESSNRSSQQQNSLPYSPSRNQPEHFYRFL